MEHCGEHLKAPARHALNTRSGDPVFASSLHSAVTHCRQCLFLVLVFRNARWEN